MFKVRKTSPVFPQEPYNWEAQSRGQCTWYVYYRCLEAGFTAPCWWDRETKTGSYTNAKDWLNNFREPWEVKGPEYRPTPGDIAVFDGEYGHVVFIEKSDGLISEYNRIVKNEFDNDNWEFGTTLSGCGPLLGYLHFPNNAISTVERDKTVNQVQCTDPLVRIRTQPNLNGEVYSHVQVGYYNVLSQSDSDGYTWYEIAKDRWCANVGTIYLPAEGDILKQIKEYLSAMENRIETLDKENKELKEKMREINEISGGL